MNHFTIFNRNARHFSEYETQRIYEILHQEPQRLTGKMVVTPSVSKLEEVLEETRDLHPDILGIGGGDGTGAQTLTMVAEKWGYVPDVIAIYALGTMNNWAMPFGLSDGVTDTIKKRLHVGETKPMALASYILQCAQQRRKVETEPLKVLDLNGRKGFNIGFGLLPKLVWMYYGKSIAQYQKLERELLMTTPDKYAQKLEYLFHEKTIGLDMIEIVTNGLKGGLVAAIGTGIQGTVKSLLPYSKEHQFYTQPMDAAIYIDGKKQTFPRPLTGVYSSVYEQSNLGIGGFWPLPTPEARSQPEKVEIVVTWCNPLEVVSQIPGLFRGKHMRNSAYFMASEMVVEYATPAVAEIDADFIVGTEFNFRYDRTVQVVAPYKKR